MMNEGDISPDSVCDIQLLNTGLHAGTLPRYLDRQTKPRYSSS